MKPILNDLNNALTYHLEGMYDAEKKLQKCLPGCLKKATSRALKSEIKKYIESAADKRTKLKRIFYLLAGPFGRKNKAVDKMLNDAEKFSNLTRATELKDAILIASLQEINHYKISAYGSARAFAIELGLDMVAELLVEVLEWEKATNKALSEIALDGVNRKAAALSLA